MTDLRVLVVDDDIAEEIANALRCAGYRVWTANNGIDAIQSTIDSSFDVAVLDLHLIDKRNNSVINGERILESWQERNLSLEVICISSVFTEAQDRTRLINLGAGDFMVKPIDYEELDARIRNLFRLRKETRAKELHCADLILLPKLREGYREGRPLHLTKIEYKLLLVLMEHPGEVRSREDLLEAGWGTRDHKGSTVVESGIYRLRKKIGHDRILTRMGYRFVCRCGKCE